MPDVLTYAQNASVHGRTAFYPDPSQDICFQITEMEALSKPAFPVDTENFVPPRTTLCFFGETADGVSVTLCLDHYRPSFLAECDVTMTGPRVDISFNKLKSELGWRGKFISKGEYVRGKTLRGFTNGAEMRLLRILCATDDILKSCIRIIKSNNLFPCTYDGRLEPMLRFTHEADITASGWMCVRGGRYTIHDEERVATTLDITAPFSCIKKCEREDIARSLVLSFDIETYSASGEFPEADRDPVIQIACTLWWTNEDKETNIIFVLDSCGPLPDTEVRCFSDERKLLMAWRDFFIDADPDYVTGYNINSFDFAYLINRAEHIRLFDFCHLGRFKHEECKVKTETFDSKAYGYKEFKTVKLSGRTVMDMLTIIQRGNVKLTSYTLNNVAQHFLNDQKEDMPYDELFRLHREGGFEGRTRIASYCVHDARLPLRLLRHLCKLPHMTEMSRVTGISINWLSSRGQSIKAKNQISRRARELSFYIPDDWKEDHTGGFGTDEDKYKGATVLSAKIGAYVKNPVAGLDFASLYPTIMRAHNLSFETLVMDKAHENYEDVQYGAYRVEDGTEHKFVQGEKRKGIVPLILEELGAARKRAKREMNQCEDPILKNILDGRQLALKVSANSIYGFCGAKLGPMTCLPIAQVTTSVGREMIEHTQKCAEEWYGGNVVYGDTDSIMVQFPDALKEEDVVEASMRMGEEAAKRISQTFPAPIELEFEKVYLPYLLFNKKRYAGLMYTEKLRSKQYEKIDIKGLEVVRRDNCRLLRTVMKEILDILLLESNVEKAKEYTTKSLRSLLQGNVPIEDLIISKSLSKKEYANTNLPHVRLAQKIEARAPGFGPKSGDRVEYVVVKTAEKLPQYEKVENPDYCREHGLEVDPVYYLDHQLTKPLTTLLSVVVDDPAGFIAGIRREEMDRQDGTQYITKFFASESGAAPARKPAPKRAAASSSKSAPQSQGMSIATWFGVQKK